MVNEATRQLVWRRANETSEYCQFPHCVNELQFEVDHIVAQKHGGDSSTDNLCLACFYCNSYKGPNLSGTDPVSRQVVPLFNPRRQQWHRHFHWEGPLLVGKTRAGRATIGVLNINEDYAVAVRQSLIEEKRFPPK